MNVYLDHLAIYVDQLEEVRDFYVKYFGASVNDRYTNSRTGLQTYFLAFSGRTRIEIMSRPDTKAAQKTDGYLGLTHLAFSLGSREEVDRLTARLAADGVMVVGAPRETGDHYYESIVLDPEGNRVELVAAP
ncbi:MAG: hypothetical protein GXY06_05940 [Clostridiaceae bacterium]|nr:hypothetical protein [Clostridiaceae bacterium]